MLGVGIIGCGAIFIKHIEAINNNPNIRLVALCDNNELKVKRLAEEYRCSYYTDYNDLINDDEIDIVHICTPHYLHYEMIIAAIKKNKHIICEKPVVINSTQISRIKKALINSSTKLCVIFQNRYNPSSIMIKEYIRNNILGKIRGIKGFLTWHRDDDYYISSDWRGFYKTEGGGLLINQAIHTIDLIQWFGGEIHWIKGNLDTRLLDNVIEVEDTAEATIKFSNGFIGVFYGTNCYVNDSPVELEIMFEKGHLRLFNNKLLLFKNGQVTEIAEDSNAHDGKCYWGNSHVTQINDFYYCVVNNKDGYVDIDEGSKAIYIIEAIRKSSNDNKKILFNDMKK